MWPFRLLIVHHVYISLSKLLYCHSFQILHVLRVYFLFPTVCAMFPDCLAKHLHIFYTSLSSTSDFVASKHAFNILQVFYLVLKPAVMFPEVWLPHHVTVLSLFFKASPRFQQNFMFFLASNICTLTRYPICIVWSFKMWWSHRTACYSAWFTNCNVAHNITHLCSLIAVASHVANPSSTTMSPFLTMTSCIFNHDIALSNHDIMHFQTRRLPFVNHDIML